MPSSGPRTLFDRATPAKKKFFSSDTGRHAAHAITGTAVSAATYWRNWAVLFFRARVIIPGWTVAHSWNIGLCSTTAGALPPAALPLISSLVIEPLSVVNS